MVKNNQIPIEVKKPFETVCELKNEIPSFEEFMESYEVDEATENSYYDELIAKSGITSYGPGEDWVRLVIPCPAKNCSSMARKEVSNWIHKRSQCQSDYERHLEWSTEARVKCSFCENPSHIMNWSFKCHNHVEYHQMDGMKFNRAIVSAINYGSINSKFSTDLLKWFEDHPF